MIKTKTISVEIPETFEREVERLVEKGMFKDTSEFIKFSLIKALLDVWDKLKVESSEEEFLEEIKDLRERLGKEGKLKSEEEVLEEIRESREAFKKWRGLL